MESVKFLVLLQGKQAVQKLCSEAATASELKNGSKLCKAAREKKGQETEKVNPCLDSNALEQDQYPFAFISATRSRSGASNSPSSYCKYKFSLSHLRLLNKAFWS